MVALAFFTSGSMSYTPFMNFEWDKNKSAVCFAERGFDFAYVTRAFVDPNRMIKMISAGIMARNVINF